MYDLAALQRFARLVFRVGFEVRPHPVGHAHQCMVALLAERPPVAVEPLVQLSEDISPDCGTENIQFYLGILVLRTAWKPKILGGPGRFAVRTSLLVA
jgi:hypothetical protein